MKPILNMKPYTIVRTTAPAPVVGRTVPGVETQIPITANVQPYKDQLMVLPEERRNERIKRLFTSTELILPGTVINNVRYNADQIIVNGDRYEVFQVDDWASDHFECLAAKVDSP